MLLKSNFNKTYTCYFAWRDRVPYTSSDLFICPLYYFNPNNKTKTETITLC